MKNKILIIVLFLILFLSLCGCNTNSPTETPIVDNNHYHNYVTSWQSDDNGHWYECECGRKVRHQEHVYDAGVVTTEATKDSVGIKTYTCQVCGSIYEKEVEYVEIKKISILGLGNSFTVDSMWLLYDILRSLGYEEIELGILYIGFSTLAQHYQNYTENAVVYEYFFNNLGTYTSSMSSSGAALEERDWDYVIVSQTAELSAEGNFARANEVLKFVEDSQPETTKIYWNVTWGHCNSARYGTNHLKMYLDVVNAAQTYLLSKDKIDYLMPTGTSVQNFRNATGLDLLRDNLHLTLDLGRFIAALSLAKSITGLDISEVWCPATVTAEQYDLAIKAVNAAHENMYAVTDILG